MLSVPAPDLDYETSVPGVADLITPIKVGLGTVVADGVPLTPAGVSTSALVTYRRAGPGAQPQVWDAKGLAWVADPATHPGVFAQSFWFAEEPGKPRWQQLVMAAGPVDGAGQPAFAKAVNGYPSYHFRGYFALPGGESALSAPSSAVAFAGAGDRDLMVLGPGEDEKLPKATQARLLLKDPSLQAIGGIVIRRDSPGAEVTVSNRSGAEVVLKPDGSIELRPAPGARVTVHGDLEADRVFAVPAGGAVSRQLD
jgi:hypothetical protein